MISCDVQMTKGKTDFWLVFVSPCLFRLRLGTIALDFSADCYSRCFLVIAEAQVGYILRLSLLVIGDEGDNWRFERTKE